MRKIIYCLGICKVIIVVVVVCAAAAATVGRVAQSV